MKKITLLLALFLSVTSISAYADSVKAIPDGSSRESAIYSLKSIIC